MRGLNVISNEILCEGFCRDWGRAEELNIVTKERYPSTVLINIFEKYIGRMLDDMVVSEIFYEWSNKDYPTHSYGVCRVDGMYIFIHFHVGTNIEEERLPIYEFMLLNSKEDTFYLSQYKIVMPVEMGEIINELKI